MALSQTGAGSEFAANPPCLVECFPSGIKATILANSSAELSIVRVFAFFCLQSACSSRR